MTDTGGPERCSWAWTEDSLEKGALHADQIREKGMGWTEKGGRGDPAQPWGQGQVRGPPVILDTALVELGEGPSPPPLCLGWSRGRPSPMDTGKEGGVDFRGEPMPGAALDHLGTPRTQAYAPQGPGGPESPRSLSCMCWALGVHTHLGKPAYVKSHNTLDCAWLPRHTHTHMHTHAHTHSAVPPARTRGHLRP